MRYELLCIFKTLMLLAGLLALLTLFAETIVIYSYKLNTISVFRMFLTSIIAFTCFRISGIFDAFLSKRINEKKRLI